MAGSEDGKATGSTCIEKLSGTKELNQAERAEDYTIQKFKITVKLEPGTSLGLPAKHVIATSAHATSQMMR